jgi:chromosome segregation ATPase
MSEVEELSWSRAWKLAAKERNRGWKHWRTVLWPGLKAELTEARAQLAATEAALGARQTKLNIVEMRLTEANEQLAAEREKNEELAEAVTNVSDALTAERDRARMLREACAQVVRCANREGQACNSCVDQARRALAQSEGGGE